MEDDGSFRISGAPAEVVQIEGSGKRSVRTSFTRQLSADADLGTLQLDPGLSIEGTVLVSGRPLALEPIWIRAIWCDSEENRAFGCGNSAEESWRFPTEAQREAMHDTTANALGRWRLEGLRPGAHAIEVVSLQYGPLHREVRAAHRRLVQAPAQDVRIELACSLTHVVPDHPRHAGSGTLDDLMVSFTDKEGRTSEVEAWYNQEWQGDGNYSMVLAAGETYQVRVWANGYAPLVLEHIASRAGEETSIPVRLVPVPQGRLRIEPSKGREGERPDVYVELLDPETGERVYWEHATLIEGGASLSLPQGAWTLVITPWDAPSFLATHFDTADTRRIVIAAGTEETIRFRPAHGGRFSLRVDVPEGPPRPLLFYVERAGARSRATLVWWHVERHRRTDWSDALQTGSTYMTLDAFPPGELTLHLSAPGLKPERLPVRIVAGQVTPVRVTLEPR